MKEIIVTVAGEAGAGKSAIAELVRQGLAIADVKVELLDDNGIDVVDERPGQIAAELNERLASIVKGGTTVRVRTVQLGRRPNHIMRVTDLPLFGVGEEPTCCPYCQARTEFMDYARHDVQIHVCPECEAIFRAEPDDEEEA